MMDPISAGSTDTAATPAREATPEVDAACDELILRWRRGERPTAEAMLLAHPALDPRGEAAFDVIYAEFLVRKELGEAPSLGEFSARFPEHEALLQRQMILHQTLGDLDDMEGAWAATLPIGDESPRPSPAGYVIERELGRGGMGIVYQARQVRLNRVVALKMIRSGGHATLEEMARLLSEAEVIAQFQHPNIVRVHAIGDCEGQPFFEMEYLAGGSLAARLDGTPRPPREASSLIETVARAIHQAHLRGIIHRDLKPANILLTADGIPKVADFGLARLLDADSGLTRSDAVLGSPGYMAPEQADGHARDAGPQADVYALGAIFYELLTGRPPFRAATALETLDLVRHADPLRPSQLQPGLPRDTETIVLKCLDKDPSRRYQTADALADDLGRFLRHETILARPTGVIGRTYRWTRRNRLVSSLAAAMALILIGGFAAMAVLWGHARQQALAARHQRDEVGRLSAGLALDRGLELARSGHAARGLHWMAETLKIPVADAGLKRAARANLAAWSALVPPAVGMAPQPYGSQAQGAISPDGRSYASGGEDGSITLWDLDTMHAVHVPRGHDSRVRSLAFSPDGGMFATAGDGSVKLWDARDARPIGPPMALPEKVASLAFHPSGKFLVATYDRTIQLWDLATHRPIGDPIDSAGFVTAKAFSPDGLVLVTTTDNAQFHRRDGRTGRLLGNPVDLPHMAPAVVFSPDGGRFAIGFGSNLSPNLQTNKAGVQLFETGTGRPTGTTMFHRSGRIHQLLYSPDGRRLLVGDYEGMIRLYDAEGAPIGEPSQCVGGVCDASFSPDGQLALIGSNAGGAMLLDTHDGRQLGAVIEGSGYVHVAFRPDGRTIVVIGDQSARCLDVTDLAAPAQVLHEDTRSAGFGPGGIRYTSSSDGSVRLWGIDGRPIGPPLIHQRYVPAVVFRPDLGLIVTGSQDAMVRLWGPDGRPIGKPIPQPHWVSGLAISRDGRRLWVGCEKNSTQLFDMADGRPIGPPLVHPGLFPGAGVRYVTILPHAKVAVSISNDGTIGRVDTETGLPIGSLQQYDKPNEWRMLGAAFSPDEATLMIIVEGAVHLSDAATGRELLPAFGRGVAAGAFIAGGKRLLTVESDRTARIRDAATGQMIGIPMEHDQPIRAVDASPDGRTLLTLTQGGGVQFWDAASCKPIGPPLRHDETCAPPRFSPDGQWIALAFGAARIWPVPRQDDSARLPASLGDRTGLELDGWGAFTPIVVRDDRVETSPTSEAQWHDRAAATYEGRRESRAALWHLDRLVAARPDDWWVHARRARALARLGRHAEAEAEEAVVRDQASPRQSADWDLHRAIDAETMRHWSDAAAAYSRALDRWPDDANLRAARGRACARAGDWAGSAADLAQYDPTRPARLDLMYCQALVFRRAGEAGSYRDLCRALLRRRAVAGAKTPLPPEVAWLFVLGTDACDDYAPLIAGIEPLAKAEKSKPDDWLVLGALLYRAGRTAEAIEWLDRAQSARPGGMPQAWAFLAMAHGRLGHVAEARRCCEQIRGGEDNGGSFNQFLDDLEIHVLRHEAEAEAYGPPLPANVFAR